MFKRLKENILEIVQQADLILLGLCCAASLFGIAMIYSATRYNAPADNRKIIVQTAALLIGIVVYFGISIIDLEMLIKRWKWIAAFDVLFILLLKSPFGVSDGTGNTAWLKFPFLPVSIGPAEVVKITFIILLAWQLQWLREEKRDLRSFSAAFYVGGHTLGIAGLYFVISGDMGNALMFLLIFVVMSFVAGFALRWFALLFGASGAAIGGIIAFDLVPDSKKYMLNRFIVLFDHSYDVQGQGWQQTRSLLTIGGGGFWGQGYLHGTQSQAGVGSVPARHTDLIFAVIGEELGFVGATLSILLLVAIIIRVLVVGRRAAQPFHTYVCVGIASMVMFQMVINIGMCLFIMPVIGLTLPFFSYGGSSLVTLFADMGFVSGIKKRTVARRRPGRSHCEPSIFAPFFPRSVPISAGLCYDGADQPAKGIRYANTGTGNSELDSIPSALRYSGRGNACRQLDLQPWGGLDPAGGGLAGDPENQKGRGVSGLRAGGGSAAVQPLAETVDRQSPSLCSEPGCEAADRAADGRLLSLRAYGVILCGGICPADGPQPAVEAVSGAGHWHCVFPAVPVCPLAHRYLGGNPCGRTGGLAGSEAGAAGDGKAGLIQSAMVGTASAGMGQV